MNNPLTDNSFQDTQCHTINIQSREQLLIIDSHVHVHGCFNLCQFLDSAYSNCQIQAKNIEGESSFTGVLLLTESAWEHWFQNFQMWAETAQTIENGHGHIWSFHQTDENCSLIARSTNGANLVVIAGRQIVTKEKLEVLALLTNQDFREGNSLVNTITAVSQEEGIPVIPWGFGKWWGYRGQVLTEILQSTSKPAFFLGDNSGRAGWLPYPSQFTLATKQGIPILPGSDPLPFPSEYWRPCSVGVSVTGPFNEFSPATHLRKLFQNPSTLFRPFMQTERLTRFLKNQLAMQMEKRRSPAAH